MVPLRMPCCSESVFAQFRTTTKHKATSILVFNLSSPNVQAFDEFVTIRQHECAQSLLAESQSTYWDIPQEIENCIGKENHETA